MTKQTNTKYRIRNWSEYNKALVNRGSLTIWFSDRLLYRDGLNTTIKGVGDRKFIRLSYPMRAHRQVCISVAFSCFERVYPIIDTPSQSHPPGALLYTNLRRAAQLGQEIEKLGTKKPSDIVFDSSGLKVYGEGEWKVRQHGKSKRRTWRKIHLALCPDSHEIVLSYLSENNEADCEVVPKMREHLPKSIRKGYGDGAYDKAPCYREFDRAGIQPIIPPQRGAGLHDLSREPWMKARNDAVRAMAGLGNDDEFRKIWKKLVGYHRRSLGETGFYRWKTLFGGELKARKIPNQRGEIYAKSKALNKMTSLGMPRVSGWLLRI